MGNGLALDRPRRLAGPGHCPFTAATRVQIPSGSPSNLARLGRTQRFVSPDVSGTKIGEQSEDAAQEPVRHQLLVLFARGARRFQELGAEGFADRHRSNPLLLEQAVDELLINLASQLFPARLQARDA